MPITWHKCHCEMQERILKKKRVLVRPNLAWAMSGLNYLETDCLPSHNGSIMNLKEYSCFFISSFQRCIFLELFHKISQKTCFMKMRMLLQKWFQPILNQIWDISLISVNLKYECCSFIHSDALKTDFWQSSLKESNEEKFLVCNI